VKSLNSYALDAAAEAVRREQVDQFESMCREDARELLEAVLSQAIQVGSDDYRRQGIEPSAEAIERLRQKCRQMIAESPDFRHGLERLRPVRLAALAVPHEGAGAGH
jgi:hypothetical protein